MNYYLRHLGDCAREAGHLSMLENGALIALMDRYYSTEAGIPANQAHRIARARSKEEKIAVDTILDEFFTLKEGIWINDRVEREIADAQVRINAARKNGKKGGRPKTGAEVQEVNQLHEQLASQLQEAGVSITSSHPNVIAWVSRGVAGKQAADAIAIARQRKPDGPIPANYLVPIIDEILSPPVASNVNRSGAWRFSDEATLLKGKELGIEPNVGEFMEPYRARLSNAIERQRAAA